MCAARNATSQNVLHVPLLLRPPALPPASGTSGTTSAAQSATFLNVLPATRHLLLLLRQHLHHLQHAPRPVSGTSGTVCASQSATFRSALLALLLLPRLPPVLPPARETSGTMCANRNARCRSVHPARLPLSHLVVTCHHLQPTPLQQQEGGRELAARMA